MEIDAEISEFAFVIFADILDGVDVKGNREAVDREDDGLGLAVDENLMAEV